MTSISTNDAGMLKLKEYSNGASRLENDYDRSLETT